MSEFFHDTLGLFGKFSTWIISILVGITAKISYEVYVKRTLSILQWFAIIGMSLISGYMMSIYCHSNGWSSQGQYLVPIATLMGEKIFIYLIENYKSIIAKFLNLKK